MKLAKKIILILICCLMTAVLTACPYGTYDADAMREHAAEALKEILSTYYGLEEDSYTYELLKVNTVSGPDLGVIWKVTTNEDLDGNDDRVFLIFMHGGDQTEYTTENIFSDRFSAQFVKRLNAAAESRLSIVRTIKDLSYTISASFSEGKCFTNYSNLLPIDVTPNDYDTYFQVKMRKDARSGIRIRIQVISNAPLTLTQG